MAEEVKLQWKVIIIHCVNCVLGLLYYLIMKPLLVQEGDPEPNKG